MKKTFIGKTINGKEFTFNRFQMIRLIGTLIQSEEAKVGHGDPIEWRDWKRTLFEEKSFDLSFLHFDPFEELQPILEHFQE